MTAKVADSDSEEEDEENPEEAFEEENKYREPQAEAMHNGQEYLDRLPPQIRCHHESYTRTADAGIVNSRVEATTETQNKDVKIGKPIANLTACLHIWTALVLRRWPELHSTLEECPDKDATEDESLLALTAFQQELEVSPRKSVWTEGQGLCTSQGATSTSSQSSTC